MTIRVLVAEDQAAVRAALVMILRAEPGFEVVGQAADGEEAVRLALELRPDVVLMDVQMPQLDGYGATRCIRSLQREDAATVPIVAMSANAFAEDVRASLEAGMNAHLSKPIDMRKVVDTLVRLTRKGA